MPSVPLPPKESNLFKRILVSPRPVLLPPRAAGSCSVGKDAAVGAAAASLSRLVPASSLCLRPPNRPCGGREGRAGERRGGTRSRRRRSPASRLSARGGNSGPLSGRRSVSPLSSRRKRAAAALERGAAEAENCQPRVGAAGRRRGKASWLRNAVGFHVPSCRALSELLSASL